MRSSHRRAGALAYLLAAGLAASAHAQSNIAPGHGLGWGDNAGWMGWRDAAAPGGSESVRVHATFLSGFAWGENIGWINVDDSEHFVGVFVSGCDWNADSTLRSRDFFDFFWSFFSGSADYNAEGRTNSQDFFDHLVAFFGRC